MHSTWYRETYPDVAALGMEPALHYLRYGAAMGRNPGKNFDTRFYLRSYPDAAKSGMNPLVHYQLHGRDKGYATRSYKTPGQKHVSTVRAKLLSLGFTERPLAEMEQIRTGAKRPDTRALAARELALWHMRDKTPEGWREALRLLDAARVDAPDLEFRRKLAVVELLCHHFLDDPDAAMGSYDRAVDEGELSPDLLLARANLEPSASDRVKLINRVLAHYDIAPVALSEDDALPAYDRLTVAQPLPRVEDGPKVTVLIAAYDAADTLPTALRSLREQTWQNLEILVLDDCSPTPDTCRVAEEFAALDPRIRVIRMEQNGGAYVARNRGLDEATGEYVTLHDADDWSHPQKIETQVRFLIGNPDVVGCLSEQARVFSDLGFTRWAGEGVFLIPNTSSFMFHKPRMKENFGYWDTVRFSADNELIRRIQAVFGKEAVQFLPTGPLSFQRDSSTSIIADAVMGVNGFFFGVRREYLHAQTHYRNLPAADLKYTGSRTDRPYPVPLLMLPDRATQVEEQKHLDVVIGADLRTGSASGELVLAELRKLRDAGLSAGVFEMNRYKETSAWGTQIAAEARSAIWDMGVRILSFGDEVDCDRLLVIDPGILEEHQRYIPAIRPANVEILEVDALDWATEGDVAAADLRARVEENVQLYWRRRPHWHADAYLVSPAASGGLARTFIAVAAT
ncbi:MAG: glycosyltransferase family 2 protein [Paracoccaceae bacterium]